MTGHAQDDANGDTGKYETGSSHADQWKGYTGYGKKIYGHCHVRHGLDRNRKTQSQCQECSKGIRTAFKYPNAPVEKYEIYKQDEGAAPPPPPPKKS